MTMAKAHYAVRLGNVLYTNTYHGFRLKPASVQNMSRSGNNTENCVELVVRPALLKYGTSEGTGYDDVSVLEKARVICE